MKIINQWPIILIKQSDNANALRKTWTAKPGAVWVLPDESIILVPPAPTDNKSKDKLRLDVGIDYDLQNLGENRC